MMYRGIFIDVVSHWLIIGAVIEGGRNNECEEPIWIQVLFKTFMEEKDIYVGPSCHTRCVLCFYGALVLRRKVVVRFHDEIGGVANNEVGFAGPGEKVGASEGGFGVRRDRFE